MAGAATKRINEIHAELEAIYGHSDIELEIASIKKFLDEYVLVVETNIKSMAEVSQKMLALIVETRNDIQNELNLQKGNIQ